MLKAPTSVQPARAATPLLAAALLSDARHSVRTASPAAAHQLNCRRQPPRPWLATSYRGWSSRSDGAQPRSC